MSDLNPIPKTGDSRLGTPYEVLKSEGLAYIEKLAGKLWSDYNTHDPGITMLELLCYAITDLEYRISMPVEELLAKPSDNHEAMHRQFLSAIRALPCRPVTAHDYRQLFLRLRGVRNAWILPSSHDIIVSRALSGSEMTTQLRYAKPGEVINREKESRFTLQGINKILIDFDRQDFPLPEDADDSDGTIELAEMVEKEKVKSLVKEVYQRFRNLCEDLGTVEEVPLQGVVICGDIEIEPMSDPEAVWALIVCRIDDYLSPAVQFHTLQEMQEMGKTTDEIFEGPLFRFDDDYAFRSEGNPFVKKGFVNNEDLTASELRPEVRLSDIIRIIMESDGVRLVKSLEFGLCDCSETDPDQVRSAIGEGKWNLCIAPGHKPVLCTDNSVINLWKERMPIELKKEEAGMKLRELRRQQQERSRAAHAEDIEMPLGKFRNTEHYTSIQNDFPEVYGIGRSGLPDSASTKRKAQAKQLKGYLLFYDQILANYFSQLAHAGELLSADRSAARTYFSNVVSRLKGSEEIFTGEEEWKAAVDKVIGEASLDQKITRKNRFLDHLLARFAEQFNEYVFVMYRLYSEEAGQAVIRHKAAFLQQYETMSAERGSGFDYYNQGLPDPLEKNVTGPEKRISGLLGFNTFRHIPLSPQPYHLVTAGTLTKIIDGESVEVPIYGWDIHQDGDILLKGSRADYLKKADALEAMGRAAILGADRMAWRCRISPDQTRVTLFVITASGEEMAHYPGEVAVLPGETATGIYSQAESLIDKITHFLSGDFKTEGIYVVEHLLLRPSFDTPPEKHDRFFHICVPDENGGCLPVDPYSFRATIVLPGYSARLRNRHFRRFADRLIRMEIPAHVMPRICFVSEEFLKRFEKAFHAWLTERESSPDPSVQASDPVLKELKLVLEEMFTVYQEGELTDCDDDTIEQNPVVLGLSSLGSLETGTDE